MTDNAEFLQSKTNKELEGLEEGEFQLAYVVAKMLIYNPEAWNPGPSYLDRLLARALLSASKSLEESRTQSPPVSEKRSKVVITSETVSWLILIATVGIHVGRRPDFGQFLDVILACVIHEEVREFLQEWGDEIGKDLASSMNGTWANYAPEIADKVKETMEALENRLH